MRTLVAEFPASEAAGAQKALHELSDDLLYAKLPSDLPAASGTAPFSLAALDLSIHSFGGVTLGMTASQLENAKGTPVKRMDPQHWVYNSIDAAHDGLLDVYFTDNPDKELRNVRVVLFSGKREAEPRGMANLLGRKRQYLVRQFGEPVHEEGAGPHSRYLYFPNGIIVVLTADTSVAYGIYATTK